MSELTPEKSEGPITECSNLTADSETFRPLRTKYAEGEVV